MQELYFDGRIFFVDIQHFYLQLHGTKMAITTYQNNKVLIHYKLAYI